MNSLLQHLFRLLWQLWRRLISLLRGGKYEREMEEEMRFHLEMQIEQNLSLREWRKKKRIMPSGDNSAACHSAIAPASDSSGGGSFQSQPISRIA